jgi:hypothetical protein
VGNKRRAHGTRLTARIEGGGKIEGEKVGRIKERFALGALRLRSASLVEHLIFL